MKREGEQPNEENEDKNQKTVEEGKEEGREKGSRKAENAVEGSPSAKTARLYPPHYAGIESIEAHGDEEAGLEYMPEEINDEPMGYGGEEDDPPEVTEEELMALHQDGHRLEAQLEQRGWFRRARLVARQFKGGEHGTNMRSYIAQDYPQDDDSFVDQLFWQFCRHDPRHQGRLLNVTTTKG